MSVRYLLTTSVLLTLLSVSPAVAQQRTGRIEGTIYDDEGMPLPGAHVSASSPTQIGGSKTATTAEDGSFRLLGLIPGEFKVVISKSGFISTARKGVRISVGRTVTLDILLDRSPTAPKPKPAPPPPTPTSGPTSQPTSQPAGPRVVEKPIEAVEPGEPRAETYVITAARPVVDVTKATTGETLSDEYLESVPMMSRSYQGVAQMTPNVTGGANPNVSGGAYFNNTYMVDGMETTDPVTHTFSTNFNFDAMADVNVMTGGMGPEYSDTPGGVVNMVTKSGSNKLELDSSIYYQDDGLTIKRPEEMGSTFSNLDFNLNVGGPILKDKLWYYTSFELNRAIVTAAPDPNKILPDHPAREYLGIKFLGKLTWQPSPKHKLVWWAQTDPASIYNTRNAITVEPDAESHQNQYGILTTAAWEWLAKDNLFFKTQLGFSWNTLSIFPESGIQDIPSISDIGTGVSRQNYSFVTTDSRYRISLQSDATYFLDKFGKHEIKGGFRYSHVTNPSTEAYTANATFSEEFGNRYSRTLYFTDFDEASACDPTSPKYDAQKCAQGTLSTSVSGNKLIAFLQDTWKLPRLRRLSVMPGAAFHFGNNVNPEGETVNSFVSATGHLNFALDLFDDGKTVIRGGYNQYVDMGFLALARFIGRDLIAHTCFWDENTQSYSANCRVGGLVRTVGRPQGPDYDSEGKVIDSSKFNPDALTVPRTHELTFGGEREWLTGFSTGLDFQWREYTNQWEDLETNVIWNQVGDNTEGFKSGKSEFVYDLETPEEAYRRYLSLTFFARKFVGNWQVMASYTWSRTEGTVSEGYATVFLDRARQAQFFDGYLPSDRRHTFKLSGWYRFPWGLTLGGRINVRTGNPYDKLYFNEFFADYADRRAQRGMDPGDLSTPDDDVELRMPTQLFWNLKVTYTLSKLADLLLDEPLNLELVGEVFNLFNLRTATSYEQRNLKPGAPTQWGDILDRQSPFRVRFGLRYRY